MFATSILFYFIVTQKLNGSPLHKVIKKYDNGGANIAYLGKSIYGNPSKNTGELVKNWKEESQVNPEELGEYIEGDILFPSKNSKNGLIAETAHWPGGVIPYEINGQFTNKERGTINASMELYHKYTCIRFRKRVPSDSDWISILSGNSGCWSSVGRIGGKQDVNLQTPNCLLKIGTVIHELLHSIGFYHEQNRWERDSYIKINFENIEKGKENNFKKADMDAVSGFGIDYDYGSVMHYSVKAFSKNGEPTISILQNTTLKVGQREGFSKNDLCKIHAMYNCQNIDLDLENNTINQSGSNEMGLLGGLISMIFP